MVVCCTIVTRSHVPYARVLARSIQAHDPGGRLIVLLADRFNGEFDPAAEPFELIRLEDLHDAERIERMAFFYTPYQFCCSLRGHLHEHLMATTDLDRWLFLDGDTRVYDSLTPVLSELDGQTLLLSPHFLAPRPNQPCWPDYQFLQWGVYNGGVLGIRRCPEADRFIAWFKQRLIAGSAREDELAWDQGWLSLAPGQFEGVRILSHPGVNVGPWNDHERPLTRDPQGRVLVAGQPLVVLHVSERISPPTAPHGKSDPQNCYPRDDARSAAIMRDLAWDYATALREQGLERLRPIRWAFASTSQGTAVPSGVRNIYRTMCRHGWMPSTPPFDAAAWVADETSIAPARRTSAGELELSAT